MDEDKMVLVVSIHPQLLEFLFVELLDVQGGNRAPKKKDWDD